MPAHLMLPPLYMLAILGVVQLLAMSLMPVVFRRKSWHASRHAAAAPVAFGIFLAEIFLMSAWFALFAPVYGGFALALSIITAILVGAGFILAEASVKARHWAYGSIVAWTALSLSFVVPEILRWLLLALTILAVGWTLMIGANSGTGRPGVTLLAWFAAAFGVVGFFFLADTVDEPATVYWSAYIEPEPLDAAYTMVIPFVEGNDTSSRASVKALRNEIEAKGNNVSWRWHSTEHALVVSGEGRIELRAMAEYYRPRGYGIPVWPTSAVILDGEDNVTARLNMNVSDFGGGACYVNDADFVDVSIGTPKMFRHAGSLVRHHCGM